jgi:hypothetical protein
MWGWSVVQSTDTCSNTVGCDQLHPYHLATKGCLDMLPKEPLKLGKLAATVNMIALHPQIQVRTMCSDTVAVADYTRHLPV